MRRIQLLALGTLSFFNALVCKVNFQNKPNVFLLLLCWFFAITSIVALWKLLNTLDKR